MSDILLSAVNIKQANKPLERLETTRIGKHEDTRLPSQSVTQAGVVICLSMCLSAQEFDSIIVYSLSNNHIVDPALDQSSVILNQFRFLLKKTPFFFNVHQHA